MPYFKAKETLIITQESTITNRNISLRPTKLCLSLMVLSVAIWVGAVNYQVNVAYAVCFWVIGFMGVSALLTKRQLQGLQVAIRFSDEVFAGQTANVSLHFRGGMAKRSRVLWWQDETTPEPENRWHRVEIFSGSLNVYETIWQIPITQRGYFPSDLFLKLGTSAPFGLFDARCCLQWQSVAVAYAAPLPHNDFGTAATLADETQTPQQTGAHGEDIAYLKNHQDGASLQHIAWKVYAKRGELMDKVFDEPPPTKHSSIISYRDYPPSIPTDQLASLLTYRVLQADKLGAVYTLELPHLTLTPQNGLREKCLNTLALL